MPTLYRQTQKSLKEIFSQQKWNKNCCKTLSTHQQSKNNNAFKLAARVCGAKHENVALFTDKQKAILFSWIVYWLTQSYIDVYRGVKAGLDYQRKFAKAMERLEREGQKFLASSLLENCPWGEWALGNKLKDLIKSLSSCKAVNDGKIQESKDFLRPFLIKRRIDIPDLLERDILKSICEFIQEKQGCRPKAGKYSRGVKIRASEAWQPIIEILRSSRTNSLDYIRNKLRGRKQMPAKVLRFGFPFP